MGPHLQYQEVNNKVNLSCTVEQVFPEPQVELDWDFTNDSEGPKKKNKEEYTDKYRYCQAVFKYARCMGVGLL